MTKYDENQDRIIYLTRVIEKAMEEIEGLGPRKGFIEELQRALDRMDDPATENGSPESRAIELCELVTSSLNVIQEEMMGFVNLKPDSLAISTDVGLISYDPETSGWYFRTGV